MMILFVIIIGVLVYFLVTNNSKPVLGQHHKENAIDILKMRYVNGEISDEEYEKMLKLLKE